MALEELRKQIDAINQEIIALCAKRLEVALKIAKIKTEENLPVFDPIREDLQKQVVKKLAKHYGISAIVIEEIFSLLVDDAKIRMQMEKGK